MNAEIKQRIDQLRRGEIPKGYQKTEFGIFPCDWVTDKKLKDLGTFGKGKGLPGDKMKSEGVPCVGYGDIYMKYNHFHFEKAQSFVDQETAVDGQPIQKGTLLFTGTGETADEIGKCVCYNGDETIYAGGDIITFVSDQVEPMFLAYQQYQSFSLRRKASFGQGHSVVHIQCENLGELPLAYPADRVEQRKIVDILLKWDKAIELQERLIEKLKTYKTICLEKMFPAKGKDVPEWRFKGFSARWRWCKLGDVSIITIGEFVIRTKQNPNSPYPVYNGGTSYTGFYDEFNNEGNKILVSGRGAAGYVNIVKTRYWAGNSCYSIDVLDKSCFDTDFIYHEMKRNQFAFIKNQQVANIPSVSKTDVETFGICVPSYDEQKKIAAIFKSLDDLIAFHQQRQDALQKQRKVLQQYLLNGIVRVK